jgi:putative N6-adenine-specific DNA methylase
VLLLNPPYGERIAAAGVAGRGREAFRAARWRSSAPRAPPRATNAGDEFFQRLAAHWKSHYAGWSAWLLTPTSSCPAACA